MSGFRREDLIRALPYARRFARALAGGQAAGDALVTEAVKALLADEVGDEDARYALYRGVTERAGDVTGKVVIEGTLTAQQRKLLLLTSLEEVPLSKAASITGLTEEAAEQAIAAARDQLRLAAAADVLIIEDEPIIAMDIEALVENCGHRVVGVASTEAEAVEIAERCRPGLILADINLGAGGDGTSAVSRILRSHYAPVIFVTAYPERLLTGEALEPAFVITKPFEPLTLAIATYQAVTGGVRLT
jgi:CheY-like chemotaxis protein